MENKKRSELLKKLSEVIEELRQITDNDDKQSFIILARVAEFDPSVHFIAASGSGRELAKNVFGLLAVSRHKEFVRDALEVYNSQLAHKSDRNRPEHINLSPNNNQLN